MSPRRPGRPSCSRTTGRLALRQPWPPPSGSAIPTTRRSATTRPASWAPRRSGTNSCSRHWPPPRTSGMRSRPASTRSATTTSCRARRTCDRRCSDGRRVDSGATTRTTWPMPTRWSTECPAPSGPRRRPRRPLRRLRPRRHPIPSQHRRQAPASTTDAHNRGGVRRASRRCGCAALMAIGLAGLTAVPTAATDTYPSFGPLEIRIFGANGGVRDFLARSAEDRRGAIALVDQIAGAIQGPAQPIEEAAVMLPHYRIGVSHLGLTYVTTPWARLSETSFIYFPGGQAASFMVVEFSQGQAALEQRWILPAPEVAALLERHLPGLRPIGLGPATRGTATAPWNMALGAVLLAEISLRLFVDRRRSVLSERRRSAGKGTDQRS